MRAYIIAAQITSQHHDEPHKNRRTIVQNIIQHFIQVFVPMYSNRVDTVAGLKAYAWPVS